MCNCGEPTVLPGSCSAFSRRQALRWLVGLGAMSTLASCDSLPLHLVSDETVAQLGLETWQRIRAEIPRSRDPAAQRLTGEVANRLLRAAGDEPTRWEVVVLARPEANAFVLPGRKIGVFEGMLQVTSSRDELAAVLGHEIGHLQAEHPAERLSAEFIRRWGLQLVSAALQLGDVQYANEIAALLGVGIEFGLLRPYSRRQELEADRLGLVTMAKAGFEPRAAVRLWERMDEIGGQSIAILSTHPAPRARIEAIEKLIPEVLKTLGANEK
jgi:predicted Zn-dependent protease